jgi:hypothetical protein
LYMFVSTVSLKKFFWGWQNGLSGREPAQQAWGPEFKLQYWVTKTAKKVTPVSSESSE